jgi:hypothetical protein
MVVFWEKKCYYNNTIFLKREVSMPVQELLIYIGIVLIVAFLIFAAVAVLITRKKLDKDGFSENDFKEPIYDVFSAKITDIKCDIGYDNSAKGIRTPELVKNFAVSFELEHGEVLTLCVPEEYYGAFEIGQEGKLTLASEQFLSFEAENCENK